ncbi:hypothetical protein Q7P37_003839 [Cladosporium fusiforme]
MISRLFLIRVIAKANAGMDQEVISDDEYESEDVLHDQSHARDPSENPRNDEELMLLVKRRGLLSRVDWLALRPTKPLRLGFPASRGHEQIGRRKRIKKRPSKEPRPAQQRPLSPLFIRPDTHHYLMSGALPPAQEEYIEVKVGTDAFGSRGFSSQSDPTANASISPLSRSFSHLSEEPMLLGADGDTFDADQVVVPAVKQLICPADNAEDFPQVVEDDDSAEAVHVKESDRDVYRCALTESSYINAQEDTHFLDTSNLRSQVNRPLPDDIIFKSRQEEACADPEKISGYDAQFFDVRTPAHAEAASTTESTLGTVEPAIHNALQEVEESTWKRLLGIPTHTPSSISKKALKSSSQHLTLSDGTSQAGAADYQHGVQPSDPVPRTDYQSQETGDLSYAHHSMSSQKLPTVLHDKGHSRSDVHGDIDGEALWREFIIGSQDGESEDELHLDWQRERKKRREDLEHNSEPDSEQARRFELSGLGTSDEATPGGTAVSVLIEPPAVSPDPRNADSPCFEHDSIEDVPIRTTPKRTGNIHAVTTMSQNPRRFKKAPEIDESNSRRVVPGYKALRQYLDR